MLSFFRGKHGSKLILVFLGLVLAAMVVSGVGTQGNSISNLFLASGDAVARVGSTTISQQDVAQRAQNVIETQRQQQPDLTIQSFAAGGGIAKLVDSLVGFRAITAFAEAHGMRVSPRSVDAELATIPSLQGSDGKFDHNKLTAVLMQKHINEQQVRDDIAHNQLLEQLIIPLQGAVVMPKGLVAAYAALQLEQRDAKIAIIPTAAMTNVPSPSAAEVSRYYAAHAANYTIPERRMLEYVVYNKAQFADAAKPSEAEILATYAAHKADYAAKELRTLTQVIVPDAAKAKTLAAHNDGAALKAAAKAIGYDTITLASMDQATFANQSSPEVAKAAFAAARGTIAPPVKSGLGWYVLHVDAVEHDPGKTLDQARGAIISNAAATKIEELFANFQNKIQDKASAGTSFADLVRTNGGAVAATPAITANGASPDQPTYQASPDLAFIIKDAFKPDSKAGSAPLLVPYGKTRDTVALYHIKQIEPAGAVPLAKIASRVALDARVDAATKAARTVAQSVADKANHGVPLADAVKATGLGMAKIENVSLNMFQLIQQRQQVPIEIRNVFTLPLHHAQLLAAPNRGGWMIEWLDKKTPADASKNAQLLSLTEQQMGQAYGQELSEQFSKAAQLEVGAKTYPANIAALTRSLVNSPTQ